MQTVKHALLLFASALILAGCTSLDTAAPPSSTLVARGKDAAFLESGRRVYLEDCTRCHAAEPVRDYAASRWPGIIADMGARSHLSAEQHRAVLAYVLAASHSH